MVMKTTIIALGLCLLAGNAWAIADPTPDLIGLYFDMEADVYCLETVLPYAPFSMYAVVSNPSVTEMMGFEFGLETPGDLWLLQVATTCNSFWDPIEGIPYVVGCGSPVSLGPTTMLVRFDFLLVTPVPEPVYFYLTGAEIPSLPGGEPCLWLPGGECLPLQIRGGPEGPTAMFNTDCVVDTSPRAFDAVKAAYR